MPKYNSNLIDQEYLYERLPDAPDGYARFEARPRPVIVCLCGSTRFWTEFQKANYQESMVGKIVLTVACYANVAQRRMVDDGCMGPQEVVVELVQGLSQVSPEQKLELDKLHLRKIDLADEVLVLNVNGYVGDSGRNEIRYAINKGKTLRWWEPDKIPSEFLAAPTAGDTL